MDVRMNVRRWGMAVLGAYSALAVTDWLIHSVWLGPTYQYTAAFWRPAEQMRDLIGFMVASQAALAVLLTFVYAKGYEAGKGTVAQGFRFGVLMGLLLFFPSNLMKFFVYPYPISLIFNWFLGGVVQTTITGLVIGYLYKPEWKV